MTKNALKLRDRAIKKRIINLFVLVFFILLFPFDILAYTPELPPTEIMIEDFENYPYIGERGFLTEENSRYYIWAPYEYFQLRRLVYSGYDWVGTPHSTTTIVGADFSYLTSTSTEWRIYTENAYNGIIDISFDFYPGRQSNNATRFVNPLFYITAFNQNDVSFGNVGLFRQGFGADAYDLYMTYSTGSVGGATGGTEIYANPWDWTTYGGTDRFRIQLDPVIQKFRWQVYSFSAGSWGNWSDWQFFLSQTGGQATYFTINFGFGNALYPSGSYGIIPFVDNISYIGRAYWPTYNYDYDISINVDNPVIGSINIIDTATTTTNGSWQVNNYSNINWNKILAVVKDMATLKTRAYYQEIEGTSGSSGNFEIEIYDLPDGNYQICWAGSGFSPGEWWARWLYFYCGDENRTILRVGDYPEFPRYILLEEYTECDYEICEDMSVLENLTCKISNFALSLTCPDPEKLLDLNLSIKEITLNRFPMSYLRIAMNEYIFLKNEIQNKDDFTITIFGNEASISVDFFDNIQAENGTTLTEYIKIFINGLIVLSFVIFAIYILMKLF